MANLSDARLNGANLSGAEVDGVDLSEVKYLTQEQLNSADGDANTRLPEGLQRPDHWPLQRQVEWPPRARFRLW
jgi:uncharacterized protein YjbI with pentapeptide repeats